MLVTIELHYQRHNVIPPRCRKPRTVEETGSVAVEISEIDGDAAPVAFRVPNLGWKPDEHRWWNGALWLPHLPWAHQTEPTIPGDDKFPVRQTYRANWGTDGLDAAIAEVHQEYRQYLIIDGVVWRSAWGEPRYVIHTLGLGHNHSSTCLSTDSGYNPNIHRSRYYRADQYSMAVAAAVAIAVARGDTNSVERIKATPPIEVLIPEAVRCDPPAEGGEGDPFLNQLHAITAAMPDAATAGLAVVAITGKVIAEESARTKPGSWTSPLEPGA